MFRIHIFNKYKYIIQKCRRNFLLKALFLWLRGFQHGPSRAQIEDQPILPTARLARDMNNLIGFDLSGIRTQEALYADSAWYWLQTLRSVAPLPTLPASQIWIQEMNASEHTRNSKPCKQNLLGRFYCWSRQKNKFLNQKQVRTEPEEHVYCKNLI